LSLSSDQLDRYSRQLRFEGLGPDGQERLLAARVAVLGCGALGSVIAEILARAGVGSLRLVDRDFVDASNLPRQSLFDETDVAQVLPKAVAAARHLARINSACQSEPIVAQISAANIQRLIADVDLVLDGTDNFPTRFLLNDAAAKYAQPWIFGSALAARGMMLVVRPGRTPCLRCVLGDLPAPGAIPTCDQSGVLASAVHVVAALQCLEALKFLSGRTELLERRLVDFDLWKGTFAYHGLDKLRSKGRCRTCEQRRFDYLDAALEPPELLAGRDGVQVFPAPGAPPPDLARLVARAPRDPRAIAPTVVNEYLARFGFDAYLFTVFADGRAIIQGTTDPAAARRLYNQYVVAP
jgi:adenylyltransferase/sulfurtransferase